MSHLPETVVQYLTADRIDDEQHRDLVSVAGVAFAHPLQIVAVTHVYPYRESGLYVDVTVTMGTEFVVMRLAASAGVQVAY